MAGGGRTATAGQASRLTRVLRALGRPFVSADYCAIWTVTVDGALAGTLFKEGERLILSVRDDADPRLRPFAGLVADPDRLEERLGTAIGAPRRLRVTILPTW
jgi:hypothetical protein